MELAANWPDERLASPVSPLIDLDTRAIGQQGASGTPQRERLSEETPKGDATVRPYGKRTV